LRLRLPEKGRFEVTQTIRLRLGDCVEILKDMKEGEVGAIVSDPPY
jgi:DNA modification methylase